MSFPASCVCPAPGECEHLPTTATDGIWQQCQSNPKFRLRMAGQQQSTAAPPKPVSNETLRRKHVCESCSEWQGGYCSVIRRVCSIRAKRPWSEKQCPLGRWELPYAPAPIAQPSAAGFPIRFDETNLAQHLPGKRFNCSILPLGDGYLFAYRDGWRGSEVFTVPLTADFRIAGEPSKLDLKHKDANYGREDPRLFWHKGQPHISYIGVVGGRRIKHTNQLFARLSPDGRTVEDRFSPVNYPHGRGRERKRRWQKNWQFFDYANHLYAVYSIVPHVVLKIESNDATKAYEIHWTPPWTGGEMRGGAAPVLVGDEYYSFFHDRIEVGGHRVYRVGLYTFDAKPPFAPRRIVAEPIIIADRETKPADQYASVVFPGGAAKAGERWMLAMGLHDRWSEIRAFDADAIEAKLQPVRTSELPSTVEGDVVASFLFCSTPCPWRTARKIGRDVELSQLTGDEISEYVKPWSDSVATFTNFPKLQAILLHDGIPVSFRVHATCYYTDIDQTLYPMDQRWPAALKWLKANRRINRIFFTDVNDCRYTANPFKWLGRWIQTPLAAQVEPIKFADNEWFQKNAPLTNCTFPPNGLPLSCGAWGGKRADVLQFLESFVAEIYRLRDWLQRHPPVDPVNLDMLAFNQIAWQFNWRTFRADAALQTGPVIHDTFLSRNPT